MKYSTTIMLVLLLSGCFKENPRLPQYLSEQGIRVPEDMIICVTGFEDFSHFNLNCSVQHDSIQWFGNYWNSSTLLGSGNPQQISSSSPFNYSSITCLGFTDSDTAYYQLEVNRCGRNIYIPTSFTPVFGDGYNDVWKPTINSGETAYSYFMEIRNLNGTQLFQTNDSQVGWDGRYNGYFVPRAAYFYRIELTFEGEETIVYTGWIELYG